MRRPRTNERQKVAGERKADLQKIVRTRGYFQSDDAATKPL